jgi:hypothetical protein
MALSAIAFVVVMMTGEGQRVSTDGELRDYGPWILMVGFFVSLIVWRFAHKPD